MGRPSRLSGRFGPIGHPSGSVVCLRQGTASCSAGAFPVPVTSPRSHSGCLLRRLHSCAFPSQGGCPWSPLLKHLGSGDLALDGVHLHPPASPVPSGLRHGPNRLPVSPHQLTHPDWSLHMTVFLFLRRLWPVQMFSLPPRPLFVVRFTSPLPGSVVSRHGRVSPDLGQPSGLRVPSGGCHPRIIAKLRTSTGTGLTLVTLHWAKRP